MTNEGRTPTVRRRGRTKGRAFGPVVKKEDLPKIVALAAEGWPWSYVGKQFGITGTWASRLVRKYNAGLQHGGT